MPFEFLTVLLLAGGAIILPITAVYLIIIDAKADGLNAARYGVSWKKILKRPKYIISAFVFILIAAVFSTAIAFSFPILFFIILMIYFIVREYFKQKELKRMRKNFTEG